MRKKEYPKVGTYALDKPKLPVLSLFRSRDIVL